MRKTIATRLHALETQAAFGNVCKCRPSSETTFYHTADDLERIMRIRCPLHIFRNLGQLSWAPSSMPLQPEDCELCSCPPSPTRDWLQGLRGPLTEQEQSVECLSWEKTISEEFLDKSRLEVLIDNYWNAKRRQNASLWC